MTRSWYDGRWVIKAWRGVRGRQRMDRFSSGRDYAVSLTVTVRQKCIADKNQCAIGHVYSYSGHYR